MALLHPPGVISAQLASKNRFSQPKFAEKLLNSPFAKLRPSTMGCTGMGRRGRPRSASSPTPTRLRWSKGSWAPSSSWHPSPVVEVP